MIKILRVYKDLNFFLGKKIANKFIYLLVILLISSIVEMATLSLFPIYISLLLDKRNIQEIMGYDINNINFFMPLSSTLLNFSLMVSSSITYVKLCCSCLLFFQTSNPVMIFRGSDLGFIARGSRKSSMLIEKGTS